MHPQFMWWLSRATGMVGGLLLVGSLVWGVLLATRVLKPVDRPAWLLGLHRWMSSLGCMMILVHMLALVGDNYVYFGWRELFVPWGSEWKNTAVALGVIAMYLLALVQGTSLLMRWLPKRLWHGIHLTSYAVVWLGFVHGALAGTDVGNPLYQDVVMLLILAAMGFALVRVLIGTNRARARENAAARRGSVDSDSGSASTGGAASTDDVPSSTDTSAALARLAASGRVGNRAAASSSATPRAAAVADDTSQESTPAGPTPAPAPAPAPTAASAPASALPPPSRGVVLPPPSPQHTATSGATPVDPTPAAPPLVVSPVSPTETPEQRQARLNELAARRAAQSND